MNKQISKFFRALSKDTRLKIIKSLMDKEKTVNQLHEDLKNIPLIL